MSTSGTASWNIDIGEVVEEAFERAGIEARGGYDLKTAVRSLNFLFTEWSNRGINLWTVEQGTLSVNANDADYDLPADTVDLVTYSIRDGSGSSQIDYSLDRMTFSSYASIAIKNLTARPTRILVQRKTEYPTLTFWPIPDKAYTFVYWRIRRIQDAGTAITNTMDVPSRYIEAMTAGLAWRIAVKRAPERVADLKALYDEQMNLAETEDRDRSDCRIIPYVARF